VLLCAKKTTKYPCTKRYEVTIHLKWGRHGRDRMAIGFSTTCAISVYHH